MLTSLLRLADTLLLGLSIASAIVWLVVERGMYNELEYETRREASRWVHIDLHFLAILVALILPFELSMIRCHTLVVSCLHNMSSGWCKYDALET